MPTLASLLPAVRLNSREPASRTARAWDSETKNSFVSKLFKGHPFTFLIYVLHFKTPNKPFM